MGSDNEKLLLKAEHISISFGNVHALRDVSLKIHRGEIHCLAGENGCGKSTLIKIISGVYQRSGGTIEFDGKKLDKITPIDAINMGIQVIYQDFALFPNLTVAENLALNTEVASGQKWISWKNVRKIAEDAVSKINLKIDLDEKVSALSVAQKQMVAISRALMFNAKLIIMDEPTTALTRKEVDALFKIILYLKGQGIAILFISHKLNEVFEISERYTIFRNGELVSSGNTKDLDDQKFTYYMTGREFEEKKFIPEKVSKEAIFELKDLSKHGAFNHINIQLHGGEILGITGLLDSGRTELALAMFGITPVDSGKIFRNGKEVNIKNTRDAIACKIGYVPEDRLSEGLFLQRSIADNIIISEIDRLTNNGIYDKKMRESEVTRWVKEMEVKTNNPDNPVTTLSGGNQQKVVLAKWLAVKPEVLILNGPTVGVDIGSKHDIHSILQKLANGGMGLIIISDDLPEIVQNCSRVDVIKDGRIVGEYAGNDLNETAILDAMM
ncbi:sugar ABC transporter ATP-binding protein [Bilifractor sp. LCP19S3_H10]|uniref:sugar ABC transporter ATP-binding protein n=1 Tax=Bilifractor sp. LCP19S3_H10 TaxID=3438736 RepID=UPI003F918295